MHIVVIHGWQEATPELVRTLAEALGLTTYELGQRLFGTGPLVAAVLADPHQAQATAQKLDQSGVKTLMIDGAKLRHQTGHFQVRRFELHEGGLRMETADGQTEAIAYSDVNLLLAGTRMGKQTETKTVTEHKFSLGKTLLSGGLATTKKVERVEEFTREERENMLYLYAGQHPPVVFTQSAMNYDGFGAAMKLTQELNFAFLKSELRRLCPAAGYDDRLLTRLGQVRVLGPALSPESHLDLAFHILARTLRPM